MALAVAGLALGGCASNAVPGMSNLSGLFGSQTTGSAETANASAQPGGPPAADISCPSIVIRQGASTYQVSADPREPSPVNMRYQVGIGDTARECRIEGTDVVMRIGIQGRVIQGPQGGPGQLEVPLRLAVVREGPEPRPIATDLYRINVTMPPGNTNMAFTHIEEAFRFPRPPGNEIDAYVVYVGFDPLAARTPPRQRRAPRRN